MLNTDVLSQDHMIKVFKTAFNPPPTVIRLNKFALYNRWFDPYMPTIIKGITVPRVFVFRVHDGDVIYKCKDNMQDRKAEEHAQQRFYLPVGCLHDFPNQMHAIIGLNPIISIIDVHNQVFLISICMLMV